MPDFALFALEVLDSLLTILALLAVVYFSGTAFTLGVLKAIEIKRPIFRLKGTLETDNGGIDHE